MKTYWSGYALYIYFGKSKNRKVFRYIPQFHSGSKDKRRFLLRSAK